MWAELGRCYHFVKWIKQTTEQVILHFHLYKEETCVCVHAGTYEDIHQTVYRDDLKRVGSADEGSRDRLTCISVHFWGVQIMNNSIHYLYSNNYHAY